VGDTKSITVTRRQNATGDPGRSPSLDPRTPAGDPEVPSQSQATQVHHRSQVTQGPSRSQVLGLSRSQATQSLLNRRPQVHHRSQAAPGHRGRRRPGSSRSQATRTSTASPTTEIPSQSQATEPTVAAADPKPTQAQPWKQFRRSRSTRNEADASTSRAPKCCLETEKNCSTFGSLPKGCGPARSSSSFANAPSSAGPSPQLRHRTHWRVSAAPPTSTWTGACSCSDVSA
jgi:hypothetical protein